MKQEVVFFVHQTLFFQPTSDVDLSKKERVKGH